jgi:transposase-like protein
MKTKNIDNFLTTLTSIEKKYLLEKLKETIFGSGSNEVVKCPCCGKQNFFKKGTYKGVQKYGAIG